MRSPLDPCDSRAVDDDGHGLQARAETWRRSDGGLDGILAVATGGRLSVLSLRVAGDGSVMAGQGVFPSRFLGMPRGTLADACPHFTAGARERTYLGLVDGSPSETCWALLPLGPRTHASPTWGRGRYEATKRGPGVRETRPTPRPDLDAAYGPGGRHLALRLRAYGDIPVTVPEGWSPGPAGPVEGLMGAFLPAHADVPGVGLAGLVEFARPWTRAMADAAHGHLPFLTPDNADDRALAWFGTAGETGRRRRQAGALYPALAGIMAAEPSVASAIDGGIPFEARLAEVLAGFPDPRMRDGMTVAKLRRLRGAGPFGGMDRLARLVSLAARADLQSLPGNPRDWLGLDAEIGRAEPMAEAIGLDLADLLAPGTGVDMSWAYPLSQARDVAARCSSTLVGPVLGGGPYLDGGTAIAGRLLFGGLGIGAIGKLSDRWHAAQTRFNAALPPPRDAADARWPALFAPFRHGDVVVSCITDPAGLRAEGLVGTDGDGVEGLAHCVGGYGPECHAGHAYVASVREGGRRLSTVEFQCLQGRPVVIQHQGAGNADPPPAAMAAVKSLVDAVIAGTVRVDPGAVEGRPPETYRDGVDWTDPANLAAAHAAWRPYLRGNARAGLEGLRGALAAQAAPTAGCRASGSRGIAQAP